MNRDRSCYVFVWTLYNTNIGITRETVKLPAGLCALIGETHAINLICVQRRMVCKLVHTLNHRCFLYTIEGRSRFARLGLSVHITASFINPGVDNQTVLEIFNASSLTLALHPGTKVCQMIFMTMKGEAEYSGIFQGQAL